MSGAPAPDRPRLRAEARAHKRECWEIAGASVLANGSAVLLPFAISFAVDRGVDRSDRRALAIGVMATAVVALLNVIGTRLELGVTAVRAQRYLTEVRTRVIRAILNSGMELFGREHSGMLFARATSDIENLQQFTETALPMVLRTTFLSVLTLMAMVVASPELTAVVVVTLLPVAIGTAWYRRVAYRAQLTVRDRVARMFGHMNEHLSGLRVVQAFALEDERLEDFRELNDHTFGARMKVAKLDLRYFVVVEVLYPVSFVSTLAAGAWLIDQGRLTVGQAVAFALLVGRLFEPIQMVAELVDVVQRAASSLARVLALVDEQGGDRGDDESLPAFVPGPGAVDLRGVGFSYRDPATGGTGPPVLRDLSLRIGAGERIALVGESGSGKTTLAKLILGLLVPDGGQILIDGQAPAAVDPVSLRRSVCLVAQEGFLFNATVADNIAAVRPEATRSEVEQVCRDLGVLERFEALPAGLDTEVGSGGASVSAGERQLIAMARALLADPTVLILDEATSNLDPATEAAIALAIRRVLVGRTAIVIAHRPGTIAAADRVVRISGGRVVEANAPSGSAPDPLTV